jgi:hypothetical protein
MMTEELNIQHSLDDLQQKLLAAQQQNDAATVRQIHLAVVEPLAKLAQLRCHDYDFSTADTHLRSLEELVFFLSDGAEPQEKLGLEARLFHTTAIINDVKGTYDLFERMDYVDGAVTLERADTMYEQTADVFQRLGGEENFVQGVRGQALRVRGLRLFGLGRYDIGAADTAQAELKLEEATKFLKQGSDQLRLIAEASGLDARSGMHPAYSDSMAAYAHGFMFRARADASAFEGNYPKSAGLLVEQIAAFQQAKQPLLGLAGRVAESMTHRIAQEMDLCEKRQKHFASRTGKQSRSPLSFATILFAVLTLATLFLQLWAASNFGFADRNLLFYVIALSFALVVGGVGTGLAAWGDGTAYFKEIFSLTQKKGK